jgi:hypothetical protein
MGLTNRRPTSRVLSLTVALAFALAAGCASSGEPKGKAKAPPAEELSRTEVERRMHAHGTPGVAHQVLNGRVGTWQCSIRYWPPYSAEPESMAATSDIKWTMDGLFLEDRTRSDFGGNPFKGLGLMGFDNLKQRYVSTWIDNKSTSIASSEGGYDPDTRTFRFAGKAADPASGRMLDVRCLERVIDDDNWTSEAWILQPSGEERKLLEIAYKRVR